MLVLVPHPKLLKILPNKIVWAIWGFLVRVFVIGWYKLRYGIWYPKFKSVPGSGDPLYDPVTRYLELCANHGIRGAEARLAMEKELEECVKEFELYLEEKLGSSQIVTKNMRSIGRGIATRGHLSFQMILVNIKHRYWSLVILPGLMDMLKRRDCPMFYDVKPEFPFYKDDDVLTEINLNVWVNKGPYRVVQHTRFPK